MEIHENSAVDQGMDSMVVIEVSASDDGMTGFVKLLKESDNPAPVTKEQLMEELKKNRIIYGIKESALEKMAARPIYNIKIEVVKGLPPVFGEDGTVIYHVKRNSEYRPEINSEGIIDYKNLDYFQMVKKDQILAEIKKETEGSEGINIYGGTVPTRQGRPAQSPVGKNTRLIEDNMVLVAECDGIVHFVRDSIDINDVLRIRGNVDQSTGNVNFSGDVSIDGDICSGFTVKSGGNVVVKGVVENAIVEAAGSVHISNGINGGGTSRIYVGGNLKCKYIEYANIHAEGNINADYIIDSDVTCMGNIELVGQRELIAGGQIRVLGDLKARDIGSGSGRVTKIEVIGTKIMDTDGINKLTKTRDELNAREKYLTEGEHKLKQVRMNVDDAVMDQLAMIKKQILAIRDETERLTHQIQEKEADWTMEFHGSIICKRKLYQGVKIRFAEENFHFGLDDIEHCRIFWADGEIIQGTI